MNPRERVQMALSHKKPDRVPLNGKFLPKFWDKLKLYFHTENEDSIKEGLGIDFKRVTMDPPSSFKEKAVVPPFVDIGTGTESYLIHHSDGSYEDEWGVKRRPSRSEDCWYFSSHPLQDRSWDEFSIPDLNLPGRLDRAIDQIRIYKSRYIISAALPNLFKHAWTLRGWDNFLQDLCLHEEWVKTLLDVLMEFKLKQIEKFVEVDVDTIELGGDIGMQNSMIISPEMWRRYFKPRLHTLIKSVKSKFPHLWFFFHSDGYIKPVIPDLIEIGFDILNPIQPESMDPAELKVLYGNEITFDGTISLQKTLPFGTVEDVQEEVIQRITTCGMNGGLILAPSNDVTADVPIENIIALYDTVKNYRL